MGNAAPKSEPSPETALFNRVADNINAAPDAAPGHARPTLAFDYERYAPLLDDPSLTEDQKREALEALWSIICSFAQLGVRVEPSKSCGKLPLSFSDSPDAASSGLKYRCSQNNKSQGGSGLASNQRGQG